MLTFHIFASSELFLGHNFFHILLYIFVSIAFSIFKAFIFCIVLREKNCNTLKYIKNGAVNALKFGTLFCFCYHIKCMLSRLQFTKCLSE